MIKAVKDCTASCSVANLLLQKQLEKWRDCFTIKLAKQKQKTTSRKSIHTLAVLCSGGCLDTIAGMRAGFVPIWSTEISAPQARMFEDLTGGICIGDTFCDAVKTAERVSYIKSGQPCTDYASSGSTSGAEGTTGWMFVKQVEVLLAA